MSASVTGTASVRPREFHFPLTVEWTGDRRVTARVEGKEPVDLCPPVVFRGDDPGAWSPEDFFVAAAASCLAVTFTGIAERAGFAYETLTVDADGVCGRRPDGRFGFTGLWLLLELETAADPAEARLLAERAEESCLVAASLDVHVKTTIVVNGR
ncbi:MAG TPA: OsmC family protein [Gaiellaceae bacterium]|nr:OsmC family protein [Gaiellaceae bacterium]